MGQHPGGPENSPQMAHLAFLLGGIHRVAHYFSSPQNALMSVLTEIQIRSKDNESNQETVITAHALGLKEEGQKAVSPAQEELEPSIEVTIWVLNGGS